MKYRTSRQTIASEEECTQKYEANKKKSITKIKTTCDNTKKTTGIPFASCGNEKKLLHLLLTYFHFGNGFRTKTMLKQQRNIIRT